MTACCYHGPQVARLEADLAQDSAGLNASAPGPPKSDTVAEDLDATADALTRMAASRQPFVTGRSKR